MNNNFTNNNRPMNGLPNANQGHRELLNKEQIKEKTEEEIVEKKEGVVITHALNVRKDSTTYSESILVIKKDEVVEILSEEDDFYKVSIGDAIGFCMKEFIKIK